MAVTGNAAIVVAPDDIVLNRYFSVIEGVATVDAIVIAEQGKPFDGKTGGKEP